MDVETNHLVTEDWLKELEKITGAERKEAEKKTEQFLKRLCKKSYSPVPEELNHAAKVALRGRQEVTISRTSGGKLSRWAASKRREKRRSK